MFNLPRAIEIEMFENIWCYLCRQLAGFYSSYCTFLCGIPACALSVSVERSDRYHCINCVAPCTVNRFKSATLPSWPEETFYFHFQYFSLDSCAMTMIWICVFSFLLVSYFFIFVSFLLNFNAEGKPCFSWLTWRMLDILSGSIDTNGNLVAQGQ
jgi:hypothetical protein